MRYPRHVTLELTAKCNLRCPYCYCVWHEYPALAKPELDAAGWKTILDKCAADGVEDILFTGGEALLRRDLFKILGYARRVLPKAKFSLFTNASRLDETLIKKFKRRKIYLATSLQGLQTYGAMTGTRRSYKRLLAVVARASELKWPIAVSMTITKANFVEAADMFVAPTRQSPCSTCGRRRTASPVLPASPSASSAPTASTAPASTPCPKEFRPVNKRITLGNSACRGFFGIILALRTEET